MNMLCVKLLPFNWSPPPEYWYVGAQGDNQDYSMVELDIIRPTSLFVMTLRKGRNRSRSEMVWLLKHCQNRRSNRP